MGAESPAWHRFPRLPTGPAAALRGRVLRLRRRDLDLVALRRAGRDPLAGRDAPVIAPGGHLVFSTHGLHSVSYYAQTNERPPAQLAQIRRALYQRDHWFAPEFGEEGDWGVKHPEWGTAFFTPEWLARVALPAWSIEDFAVGQNADNQDMYVLRRR